MQHQWPWRVLHFGVLVFLQGCVTETERMPYRSYYDPYQDESVLDELKREFGWKKNARGQTEAPYTRAARSVKETVSDWFSDDETAKGTPEWQQSLRQFKQAQEDAIRRSQEQQDQGDLQRMLGGAQAPTEGADNENRE